MSSTITSPTEQTDDISPDRRDSPGQRDSPANQRPGHEEETAPSQFVADVPRRQLVLGGVFGVVFGFLLQKGGVAKYHVLIGQLLLQDFTVVQVMLSAVVVGTLGIHFMHRLGLVQLHIKPTRYLANSLGGFIFGVGFALSPYCPGTGAAAVGQGNIDALAMVAGMIAGSWLFAEFSGFVERRINKVGDRGELTLHDLTPQSRTVVVIGSAMTLIAVLALIEVLT